ncbi:MAG: hypothetical protein MUC51_06480, partial [Anaerolineae bacterium]|nr:hypothetical protein [Anaerolineae bacterium]
ALAGVANIATNISKLLRVKNTRRIVTILLFRLSFLLPLNPRLPDGSDKPDACREIVWDLCAIGCNPSYIVAECGPAGKRGKRERGIHHR